MHRSPIILRRARIPVLAPIILLAAVAMGCGGRVQYAGSGTGPASGPAPGGSSITISNLASSTTPNSATITWNTSVPAESQVEYGLTPSYGSMSALDSRLVSSHSVTISDLTPNALYDYRVHSGSAVSSNFSFFTSTIAIVQNATNTINVEETSGSSQTNRPISVARVFKQGEIANFAQAVLNGTTVLTQCDVKSRWPDGSLKFAIVSLVLPSLAANSSVTVGFQNQPTGNNTGYLTQAELLDPAFDFDGEINITGAVGHTISARTILGTGDFRYWLQGPIVTAVIIEDRSQARSFDVNSDGGSGNPLHPIFEAWFYPQNHAVQLGYTLENTWASSRVANSMRDQTYSLTLTAGSSSPATVYNAPSFVHIGRTRWRKTFWINAPLAVRIDHNPKYLVTTKAFPNWDTSVPLAPSLISLWANSWRNIDQSFGGTPSAMGNWEKPMNSGGNHWQVGLQPIWYTLYFLTMDDGAKASFLGNAELAGNIPFHFREADSSAGSGHFFDAPSLGTVDTFGKVVSVNARQQLTLGQQNFNTNTCGGTVAQDLLNIGPTSFNNWSFPDLSHFPDVAYLPYLLTGNYFFLEELEYEAAYVVGDKIGCAGPTTARNGSEGFLSQSQLRGKAWAFRTLAYAAFISPDGTPEKAYFEDKLKNTISLWEGEHSIYVPIPSYANKAAEYNFGKLDANSQSAPIPPGFGPSPLVIWQQQGGADGNFVQSPLRLDGSVLYGASPWEHSFLACALGMAKQFGYATKPNLQILAHYYFNIALNRSALGANYPYYIDIYRYPAILSASNTWVQTWSDFPNYFAPQPSGTAPNGWQVLSNDAAVNDSHGFEAMSAISFMYDLSADGFTGKEAWDFMKANHPHQELFTTMSPTWSIQPLIQ